MGAPIPQGEGTIFGGCPTHWKSLGAFALVYTKTADPIKSQFGADSCGPKEAGIRWGSRSDKSIHNV